MSLFVGVVRIVVDALDEGGHSGAILPYGGVNVDVVEEFIVGVFAQALDQLLLGFQFAAFGLAEA